MTAFTKHNHLVGTIKLFLWETSLKVKKFYYNKDSMKMFDITCERGDLAGESLAFAEEIMTIHGVIKINFVHRFQVVSASKALAFGHKERQVNMTVYFEA